MEVVQAQDSPLCLAKQHIEFYGHLAGAYVLPYIAYNSYCSTIKFHALTNSECPI